MTKNFKMFLLSALLVTIFIGCISSKAFAASGTWQSDSKGWWYSYSDGSYAKGWTDIDSYYYYFDNDGYMACSEYRDGYWLNSDGTWNSNYANGTWASDSTGWWFTDSSGWYPTSQWVKIDGDYYYFKANGYMAVNETIDGCYLDASGKYVENATGSNSDGKQKYVLNNNTMRFHYPTCDSCVEMNPKNKSEVTCTRDELLKQGYIPCGNCRP